MDPGICIACRKRVSGRFKNIPLTLYCERCIHRQRIRPSLRTPSGLVSEFSATSEYKKLCREDFEALHFERFKYPSIPVFEKRYIPAEVRGLCMISKHRKLKEIERRKEEREKKKQFLIGKTGVNPDRLTPFMRYLVVGDFLSGAANTFTSRSTAWDQCLTVPRVLDILNTCPKAHPEGAMWFCLHFPYGTVKEFLELKEKVNLVFRLEGFRILSFLDGPTLIRLRNTPLCDVCEEYLRRDIVFSVRCYLELMTNPSLATMIVTDPICLEFIKAEDRYEHRGQKIALSLVEYWDKKRQENKRSGSNEIL